MRYIFFFFLLIHSNSNAQKSSYINISITIDNAQYSKIYLNNKPNMSGQNFSVINYDSAILNKYGIANFKLKTNNSQILAVELKENGKWHSFIASPGDSIQINGTLNKILKVTVSGSYENDLFHNFEKNNILTVTQNFTGRNISYDSICYFYNLIYKKMLHFINENPKTFTALMLFQDLSLGQFIDSLNFNTAKEVFVKNKKYYPRNYLFDKIQYNFFELPFKYKVGDTITAINLGKKYSKFSFNKIKTAQKFILIDFWATWCVPCIAEMHQLDTIYQKYSTKGFEILSISSDTKEAEYNRFLERNAYKWLFYSDFKGQQSKAIKQFKVISYPTNFLVNSEGIIKAINIKADKLNNFLLKEL